MRRAAAVLSLAALATLWADEEYQNNAPTWTPRGKIERRETDFTSRAWRLLPPALLLIAACCISHSIACLIQPFGQIWLLGLWLDSLSRSDRAVEWALTSAPFLVLALVSLLESLVFPRRPPSPAPERRFSLEFLLILAADLLSCPPRILMIFQNTTIPADAWLWGVAHPIGTAVVYALAAWGIARTLRWAPWLALSIVLLHLITGSWGTVSQLLRAPTLLSVLDHGYLCTYGFILLLQALTALFLLRWILRQRVMARAETPSPSPSGGA